MAWLVEFAEEAEKDFARLDKRFSAESFATSLNASQTPKIRVISAKLSNMSLPVYGVTGSEIIGYCVPFKTNTLLCK